MQMLKKSKKHVDAFYILKVSGRINTALGSQRLERDLKYEQIKKFLQL